MEVLATHSALPYRQNLSATVALLLATLLLVALLIVALMEITQMAKSRKLSPTPARTRTARPSASASRTRKASDAARRTRARSHRAAAKAPAGPLSTAECDHLRDVLGAPTAWGGKRPWPAPAVEALLATPEQARALLRAEEPMERWFVLNDLAARVTHELMRRQHRTLAYRTSSGSVLCASCAEQGGVPLKPVFVETATCAACERRVHS